MINLTPLSASASSSSSSEPVCYLLELDEARILLDLGQRDYRANSRRTEWAYEEKIRELAPTISLVLLSHSSTSYLSLYPYARARWGLQCPVYATQPTVEMGRVVCLTEVQSWRAEHQIKEDDDVVHPNGVANGDDGEGLESNSLRKGKEPLRGPFVPTVEEVHEAFDWVKAIRYNQPLHLGGDLSHLLLTPFPSGHTLGGTLFKLRSPTSGTVLYAVGVNHTSERHLDGMVGGQGGQSGYSEGVTRPDLLIVEGGRAEVVNAKRRDRERAVLDLITSTLNSNHSVLIPSDPSPRLLEILVLLDQHWSFKLQSGPNQQIPPDQLWPYPLCVVSKTAQDMVSFARSLIEWMGGVLRDAGSQSVLTDGRRGRRRGRRGGGGDGAMGSDYGVLDFRHIQFFSSPTELLQRHPLMRPKVILAVPPSLSHGPSRWLFTVMAGTEGNVILLTSMGEENTLSREVYDTWAAGQDAAALWGRGRVGHLHDLSGEKQLEMESKVPLGGAELEAHLEAERAQKEREAANQAAVDRSRRMLEADDLDTDSESGSEAGDEQPVGMLMSRAEPESEEKMQMSFDIFVKGQQMRVGRGNQAGEMARFRMFPHLERKAKKIDNYGESIDVGLWIRRGKEIEEEGETQEVRDAKRRKVEEEEKQKAPPEPPSKFIRETLTVNLQASVFYVDMEGLHDGQAIKTIIGDLQPRKIVLVRSSAEASKSLMSFLSTTKVTKDIYAPATNEEVKIGEQVASYSFQLGDSISSQLLSKWSKYEDYEVAVVDGHIVFSAGSTIPTLEATYVAIPPAAKEVKAEPENVEVAQITESADVEVKAEPDIDMSEKENEAAPKSLKSLEQPVLSTVPVPSSIFVGDLRLAILKARLGSLDTPIPAEFAGEGVLICGPGVREGAAAKAGSIVAVRKLAEGSIVLEGGIGRTYDYVRRELYKGFAQVVA